MHFYFVVLSIQKGRGGLVARRGGLCLRFHPKIGKFGTFTIVQKNKNEKKWIFFSLKGLSSKYVKMWFCYFSGKLIFAHFAQLFILGSLVWFTGTYSTVYTNLTFSEKEKNFESIHNSFVCFLIIIFFRFVKTNQHLLLYWFLINTWGLHDVNCTYDNCATVLFNY